MTFDPLQVGVESQSVNRDHREYKLVVREGPKVRLLTVPEVEEFVKFSQMAISLYNTRIK